MMKKTICELFAGVGVFRVGFERLESGWETVWFSQWEPGAKTQWAHDCYIRHFGDCPDRKGEIHTGEDIANVKKENIPDHTLLVGGFPCQDYSVAHTLASAKGIEGKKGVLWWQIRDTLIAKRPRFCIFENVDRLLKSPAAQRGRDFGIILACLNELGYMAEWRVVNAAQYGAGQRRRRVFIFASREDNKYSRRMDALFDEDILSTEGMMAKAFPIESIGEISTSDLPGDIVSVSDAFAFPFESAGVMQGGKFSTARVKEREEVPEMLGGILEEGPVDERYFIKPDRLGKFKYMKGAKKIERTARNGHTYTFSEGPIAYPDPWDKPSRTMLTSEATVNRSTHVVEDRGTRQYRLLTPREAERLQGFDDDWTIGMPDRMRYFCMGNALVTKMITRMGRALDDVIRKE